MDLSDLVRPVEAAFAATRRRWERHDLAARLARGDPTVWSADPSLPELSNRLGWLRLHEDMRSEVPGIRRLAERLAADGLDRVVLVGMGGSSLAPEVFARVVAPSGPALSVADSTHPEAVAALFEGIDPARTAFVVSSKSGTTLETTAVFQALFERVGEDGSRFVAVTDPGTPLEDVARDRGFAAVMTADPRVGGRFSALSHFGLVPAALCGIDPDALLEAAAGWRDRPSSLEEGVGIGLAWAALALAGRDKLTFLTSDRLQAFPAWMEQLIAESLGKEGAGIVPVADEPIEALRAGGDDRAVVVHRLRGEEGPDLDTIAAGHPAVLLEVPGPEAVAAEMLRAEIATAAAGEVLGVHPFDQPDVEAAKRLARSAMEDGLDTGVLDTLSPGDGAGHLARLLAAARPGDYLAVQAFLPPGDEVAARIRRLRRAVGARGLATTAGWGPRFLHSTGQLHKGGPNSGIFLQLVDRPAADLPVPGTDQTFGGIVAAQAAGDHQALVEAGRRVVRIDLGPDRLGGLDELIGGLG